MGKLSSQSSLLRSLGSEAPAALLLRWAANANVMLTPSKRKRVCLSPVSIRYADTPIDTYMYAIEPWRSSKQQRHRPPPHSFAIHMLIFGISCHVVRCSFSFPHGGVPRAFQFCGSDARGFGVCGSALRSVDRKHGTASSTEHRAAISDHRGPTPRQPQHQ